MSLRSDIHGMQSGQVIQVNLGPKDDKPVKIGYDNEPSYGDNGQKVNGAYIGRYTVGYPGGRVTSHEHGPWAATVTAARKGASPDAKHFAAERVHDELMTHFATRHIFNDKRRA